nr:hypothetical protein [Tanacetum cinerariifolium]
CRNEMGRGLAQRPVIMGVSYDLRGDSWGYVPRSLFWREDLDGDGERGFDSLTFALVSSKAHREGCRALHGGFPYYYSKVVGCNWEKIPFRLQRGGLRTGEEEMAFRNFLYTEDDDDLTFLPKEKSLGFGTSSLFALVNTELPKDVEEPEGGSSRPLVKRKLAFGSSSSRVVRAKTSAFKDDAPILSISDDDEGLPDCFKLKDTNSYHLKISAITPPAWKGHLDNQMDLELLDLHDWCYARQAVIDNAVNKRAREFFQVIQKMRGEADVIKARKRSRKEECKELRVKYEAAMVEFDQNLDVLALRKKISSLTADVKEHKGNLDRMMIKTQKWAGYQVTLLTLESKVDSLEVEKARLKAVEASLRREVEELKQNRRDIVSKVIPYTAMKLVHSEELGMLVGMLVSSAITYIRCMVYEQVATMKEPFNLSKAKGYRSSYEKEHT